MIESQTLAASKTPFKSRPSSDKNENRFLNFGNDRWTTPLEQTEVSMSASQLFKTLMTSSIWVTSPVVPSMQTIPVKIGGKLTPPIARLAARTSDFLFSRICCSLKFFKEFFGKFYWTDNIVKYHKNIRKPEIHIEQSKLFEDKILVFSAIR